MVFRLWIYVVLSFPTRPEGLQRLGSERTVGPLFVVFNPLGTDDWSGVFRAYEVVTTEVFVSKLPVEAFALAVLHGVAGFNEGQTQSASWL